MVERSSNSTGVSLPTLTEEERASQKMRNSRIVSYHIQEFNKWVESNMELPKINLPAVRQKIRRAHNRDNYLFRKDVAKIHEKDLKSLPKIDTRSNFGGKLIGKLPEKSAFPTVLNQRGGAIARIRILLNTIRTLDEDMKSRVEYVEHLNYLLENIKSLLDIKMDKCFRKFATTQLSNENVQKINKEKRKCVSCAKSLTIFYNGLAGYKEIECAHWDFWKNIMCLLKDLHFSSKVLNSSLYFADFKDIDILAEYNSLKDKHFDCNTSMVNAKSTVDLLVNQVFKNKAVFIEILFYLEDTNLAQLESLNIMSEAAIKVKRIEQKNYSEARESVAVVWQKCAERQAEEQETAMNLSVLQEHLQDIENRFNSEISAFPKDLRIEQLSKSKKKPDSNLFSKVFANLTAEVKSIFQNTYMELDSKPPSCDEVVMLHKLANIAEKMYGLLIQYPKKELRFASSRVMHLQLLQRAALTYSKARKNR